MASFNNLLKSTKTAAPVAIVIDTPEITLDKVYGAIDETFYRGESTKALCSALVAISKIYISQGKATCAVINSLYFNAGQLKKGLTVEGVKL